MLSAVSIALALLSVASAAPTPDFGMRPKVTTGQGTWNGRSYFGVDRFQGIPFAQPPVGQLRFAAPVATTQNYGQFDAGNWGFSCPQMDIFAGALPGVLNTLIDPVIQIVEKLPIISTIAASNASEDCLNLNVFRPAGITAKSNIPVMVWIYGGAFLWGGTSMYEPTSFVRASVANGRPVVLVSMNYRMNSFGFLPGRQVAADSSTSVNAGLLDQRLALQWVQDNIAQFGGDPSRVTVFGESAGAISIAMHLLAYSGNLAAPYSKKPLFRAAIMQSGSPIPVGTAERGQASFDTIAKATNCYGTKDAIACLRAVPYDKLLAATNTLGGILSYRSVSLPFLPRADGVFLAGQAQQLTTQGLYAKIPIISGDQRDEGTLLTLGTLNITTEAHLNDFLQTTWFPRSTADQRAQILSLYTDDPNTGSPFDTGFFNVITPQNKRISALIGDIVFQAPRRFFLQFASKTQPTWGYESKAFGALPILGSFHFTDVLAVFGILPTAPCKEMQARWTAFAYNLDPNTDGYPAWPQYGPSSSLLEFTDFGSASVIVDSYRQAGMAYIWSIVDSLSF